MLFRPRLPNLQPAPISWQIRLLYTYIYWPLEDDNRNDWRVRCFYWFRTFGGLLILSLTSLSYMWYIVANSNDLTLMLDGLAKFIILFDVYMRTLNLVAISEQCKDFLKEFYAKIYIAMEDNPKTYRKIKRYLLPTVLYSMTYIIAVLSALATSLLGLLSNQRLLIFDLWLPYDIRPMRNYVPTLLVCYWVNFGGVACIVGESNLMATVVLHLNARYELLQEESRELYATLLQKYDHAPHRTLQRHGVQCSSQGIPSKFHQSLVNIVQRNVELNNFAGKLQSIYSFRIFCMLGLSAVNLCVLFYSIATYDIKFSSISPIIPTIIWMSSKIVELLILGDLGSRLYETTDEQSSMYYLSNWEKVIKHTHSRNSTENAKLMKLILLAMELNRKPVLLMGLKFFSLSLQTAVSILQVAFSYFTCLSSLRTA